MKPGTTPEEAKRNWRVEVGQANFVGNFGWRVLVDLTGDWKEIASGFMPTSREDAQRVGESVGLLTAKIIAATESKTWPWRI